MRKGMSILFILLLMGAVLGCTSTNQQLTQKKEDATMAIKETWPSTTMTKDEMMDYFKNNVESLDPIEGVWVMSETVKWINIVSGLRGKNEYARVYVFAVIRDPEKENVFNGYILESGNEQWNKVGLLKAFFYKMAVESIYEMHWYMGDFSEKIKNISLHSNKGVFKETSSWAEYPLNYESESIYLKQYPTVKITDQPPKKLHEEGMPALENQ